MISPAGSKTNYPSESTSITISDLVNGQTYYFKIKSSNTVGTSASSDPVTVSIYDKPSFTTTITGNSGDKFALLEWPDLAVENGNPLTHWQVVQRVVSEFDDDGDGLKNDVTLPKIDQSMLEYGADLVSVKKIKVIGLNNDEKYVFEVAPVNDAGAARSTNTVVVIPQALAADDATEPDFVTNPDITDTQITSQEDKERQGDYIPPSASTVSSDNFDEFDESYNQSIIYDVQVSDTDLDSPAQLAIEYGLPEYSPPEIFVVGQVLSYPPAIIEIDKDVFDVVIVIDLPAAPTGLTATSGQSNNIPLSWTAPAIPADTPANALEGTTTSSYIVEYYLDGTWFGQEVPSTSWDFNSAIDGQSYNFRVSAINDAGIGPASIPASGTAFSAPLIPTDVSTKSGNGQVTLLWSVPATGGSPITDYEIEYSSDNRVTWDTYNDGVSVFALATVMDLLNGDEYFFRVSAVNERGSGDPSSVVSEIPAGTSTRPNGLVATTISSTQINISWNAPGDDGGSSIIGYKIDHSIGDGGNFNTLVDNTMSISTIYSSSNLWEGTDYSYRISAITANGQTSPTSGIAQSTTWEVPDAPTLLSVGATATSLQLTWAAPLNSGGTPITGYQIERKTNTVGAEFEILVATTGNTSTIYTDANLPSDTSYVYKVSTINSVGTSDATSVTKSTLGSPGAPLNLTAVAAKNKVQLNWVTPSSTGGDDITDYIVEFKLKSASAWPDTPFDDGVGIGTTALIENTDTEPNNLVNNEIYSFRVSAKNAIGTGVSSAVIDAKPSIPGATAAYKISEIAGGQDVFLPHNEEESLDNGGKMTGVQITPKDTLSSFTMTSTFLKDPPSTIDQNLGADMYIKFELDYVSEEEITANFPDAPTGLTITSPQASQIDLSWTAPSEDGGADVSGYKIEKSTDGTTWSTLDANTKSTKTTYVDGGLTNGVTYHYQISAINVKCIGTASSPVSATPLDVPSEPLNVMIVPGASGELILTYSEPTTDGGSPIINYIIQWSIDLQTWTEWDDGVNSTPTSATITDLTNGQSYIFRVFAVNAAGTVNPSALVSEIPTTVSNSPRSLTAVATSTSQITLNWVAPTELGGTGITGYKIERLIGTVLDSGWTDLVSDTGLSDITYFDTGLFGGTTYSYRVSAINDVGTSSASSAAQDTTYSVPDAPTGITTSALPSKYILSWTAPANNGGQSILDYLLQSSTNGGTTWTTITRPLA